MTPKSSYALVGVFVLVLGAALIAGLLWLTTGGPPRSYEAYLVYMTESVSGLNVDAEVKYKGVNVGRVSTLGLDPETPERVRIMLLVQKGTPVKEDTVATLELQGITGIATINLSGGSSESADLVAKDGEEYAIIDSRPSLLVRLDDTVSELLASLISTSDRISLLLDDNNLQLVSNTLANTDQLTARLSERAADLEAIMLNANQLMQSAHTVSESIPNLLARFDRTAVALEAMAESMGSAGESVEATSKEFQDTLATSGDDIRTFTAGVLPQANSLVVELKMTANNLRRVSESLKENPSQLLFGGTKPEPGPGE